MPSNNQISVLVVDDDPIVSRILLRTLRGQNYIVQSATSAEEAMQLLASVDILWLDLKLHDEGAAARVVLAEWVRANEGPVCICSGFLTPDIEHEMLMFGADNVIPKPIRTDLVSTLIARYARRVMRERRIRKLEKEVGLLRRYFIAFVAITVGNGALSAAGIDLIQLIAALF